MDCCLLVVYSACGLLTDFALVVWCLVWFVVLFLGALLVFGVWFWWFSLVFLLVTFGFVGLRVLAVFRISLIGFGFVCKFAGLGDGCVDFAGFAGGF